MSYSAIILAAGSGSRMDLDYNKIFHKIKGKKVLDYSIDFFLNQKNCDEILLICSKNDFNYCHGEYRDKVNSIIIGGSTRQESVFNGLSKVKSKYVLIHDSARPFLSQSCIDELVDDMIDTKATTLAVAVKDTIVGTSGNRLTKSIDRKSLVALQTPQAFDVALLLEAHKKARKNQYLATDDTDLIRKFTSVMPSYVMGDYRSIKLTTKEDIAFLEVVL